MESKTRPWMSSGVVGRQERRSWKGASVGQSEGGDEAVTRSLSGSSRRSLSEGRGDGGAKHVRK